MVDTAVLLLHRIVTVGRIASSRIWGAAHRFAGWRKLALRPDLVSIAVEEYRNGDQQHGDTAKQRASPLNAQTFKHVRRKEWEGSSTERSEEGVASDGRSRTVRTCQCLFFRLVDKPHIAED